MIDMEFFKEKSDSKINRILLEIIDAIKPKMKPREYIILRGFLNGVPRKTVAEECGLSVERVRQLYFEALDKMGDVMLGVIEENSELALEVQRLKTSNDMYKENLEKLTALDAEIKVVSNADRKLRNSSRIVRLMNTPLERLKISTRSRNALRDIGCNCLGDIPTIESEKQFSKVRNCGEKTIYEVGLFLEKYNLRFGMSYDEIIDALSEREEQGA